MYGGKCAYCGNDIAYKDFQVDHYIPQRYYYMSEKKDEIKNLKPSCKRCNHYKRAELPEDWRKLMITLHERIESQYINRVAIDYGIITLKPFDGMFYFEKYEKEHDKTSESNKTE
jgi:hypothetical protein